MQYHLPLNMHLPPGLFSVTGQGCILPFPYHQYALLLKYSFRGKAKFYSFRSLRRVWPCNQKFRLGVFIDYFNRLTHWYFGMGCYIASIKCKTNSHIGPTRVFLGEASPNAFACPWSSPPGI